MSCVTLRGLKDGGVFGRRKECSKDPVYPTGVEPIIAEKLVGGARVLDVAVIESQRADSQFSGLTGKVMGLKFVNHLEAMLDVAQEPIRVP